MICSAKSHLNPGLPGMFMPSSVGSTAPDPAQRARVRYERVSVGLCTVSHGAGLEGVGASSPLTLTAFLCPKPSPGGYGGLSSYCHKTKESRN